MYSERIKVVLVQLAKLMMKVSPGYSRSCDKIRDFLMQNSTADVKQFLLKLNPAKYIDP